mmetsp:Transcript_4396/g.7361  ORF Transcript_4396/g.7361 Transcript_4396/m.7361 type:complete len:134 (+) Transcript_4396:1-402(+)
MADSSSRQSGASGRNQPNVLGMASDELETWFDGLRLVYFDLYENEVTFPLHFADLTMWVARVEGGAVEKPLPQPPPVAACADGKAVPSGAYLDFEEKALDARANAKFRAARMKASEKRQEARHHQAPPLTMDE